jgi:hypothetical protein
MVSTINLPHYPQKAANIRRKLTPELIEQIGIKIAQYGMTETRACELFNVRVNNLHKWKQRHKNDVRFASLIARVEAQEVDAMMKEVTKAATGSNGIRHDWRAAQFRLKVIDPEKYGEKQIIGQQTVVNNTVNEFLFVQAAKKIYGVELPAPQPVKQLNDAMPKE